MTQRDLSGELATMYRRPGGGSLGLRPGYLGSDRLFAISRGACELAIKPARFNP